MQQRTLANDINTQTGFKRNLATINLPFNVWRQPSLTNDVRVSAIIQAINLTFESVSKTFFNISPDSVASITVMQEWYQSQPQPLPFTPTYMSYSKIIQAGYYYQISDSGNTGSLTFFPVVEIIL